MIFWCFSVFFLRVGVLFLCGGARYVILTGVLAVVFVVVCLY